MKAQLSNMMTFVTATPIFSDPSLRETFLRDGYVVVDFLEPAEIGRLLEAWNRTSSELGELPFSSTIFSRNLDYRRDMYRCVLQEFEAPTRKLLDGYRLCSCGFVNKKPQDKRGEVEIHQDPAVVDETRHVGLGIWCPLVDVTAENGCLRIVPGSHLINRRPRESMTIDFPYPELLSLIHDRYLVEVPMKAGQAFVYTQALFHSSPPNLSNRERVVAGALAVPEPSPLMIYLRDPKGHPGLLSAYQVSDEFYRNYFLGSMPDSDMRVGYVPDEAEPLSEERLQEILGGRLAV